MVKRYHGSFPSFSYEFDSRYPLHHSKDAQALLERIAMKFQTPR